MSLADLVQRAQAVWDDRLEQDLFGTGEPEAAAAAIEGHVRNGLGEPVEALFYEAGVGAVAGLVLDDGRRVVVKVHRWNVTVDGLAAMQSVQAHLADGGRPVPRPLLGPRALGTGLATVETFLPGDRLDGRTPQARRLLAAGLHDLLEGTADLDAGVPRALWFRPPGAALYPEPHSVRFDLGATGEGAEWIDAFAEQARTRLDGVTLPDRIGHLDWRSQNLAVDGDRIVAVYDSDAFGRAPEPAVVGNAAAGFCIDWRDDVADPPPTVEAMRAFVADYEAARGEAFDEEELEALDAANLAMIAYSTRCQHSDLALQPQLGDTSAIGWFRLLRERGERCFAA